jgi:hypothetical protein
MSIDFLVYERSTDTPITWTFRRDLPRANLGNQSAAAVLKLLELGDESSGIVSPEKLPELRRSILRLVNVGDNAKMTGLQYEPFISEEPGQCALIDFGLSSDRIRRALHDIEPVIRAAQTHQLWFGWG